VAEERFVANRLYINGNNLGPRREREINRLIKMKPFINWL
jgi:hypothetical protein